MQISHLDDVPPNLDMLLKLTLVVLSPYVLLVQRLRQSLFRVAEHILLQLALLCV
ncbi:hypothetical protein Hanom_Chr11g01030781 [Helianthus anomalus]